MIESLFRSALVRRRMAVSHLGIILHRFAVSLERRGHVQLCIQSYLQVAEHFSRWIGVQRIPLNRLDESIVGKFVRHHLPRCRCPKPAPTNPRTVRAALGRLLAFLREQKLTGEHKAEPPSAVERLVNGYACHLEEVAGLAPTTRQYRCRYAREFLKTQVIGGAVHLRSLSTKDLIQYVRGRSPQLCAASLRVLTVSLRDLMRFLHFRGLIPESCIAAVPRPAPWPRRALPDTIEKPELNAFLRSFDRSTATGRRDYAMALCLTQMGMRVQEVAAVTVEDLDGRQHAVRLRRTKVRRDRLLPLDQRTTGALLQYLQNGRPYTSSSALFVRHRAPLGQALQAHHVRGAMIRALARSGLQTTRVHIFRHAFATRLHRRGIGLKAIADWLGHLNLNTTAQYARVNLEELKQAALPWPEEWR